MIWTFIIHVQLLDLKFLWGWLCQNPYAIAWRNISGILILLQICSSEWNLGSFSYLVTMLSRLLDSISFRITCRTFPVSCAWDWENCNVLYFLLQFCCGYTEKHQSGHQETGPPIPVCHPRQEDVPRAAHVKAHEPWKCKHVNEPWKHKSMNYENLIC